MIRLRRIFAAILLSAIWSLTASAGEAPGFYLLEYRPGVNWNEKISWRDQPGIKAHREYLASLLDNGIMRMAGEIAGGSGELVLLRVGSSQQAKAIAARDPAVINRILDVDVIPWRVEMSTMRHIPQARQPVRDADAPFTLERLDPDAPINLRD